MGLNSKNNLKAYVVGCGVLYGNGELGLQEIFRSAWEQKSNIRVVGSGTNFIPTVHVRDMANVVNRILYDGPECSYVVAVDRSALTQKELLSSIVSEFQGTTELSEVSIQEALLADNVDLLTLDLKFDMTPLPGFNYYCEYFDAALAAAELKEWLNLKDIKIAVCLPPGLSDMVKETV